MAKRDSQRSAVYTWERKLGQLFPDLAKSLEFTECVKLVNEVWRDYRPGETSPEVTDGRGRRHAAGSRWFIKLPKWARNPRVVLHEVAHSLSNVEPYHGPEFARLLLELYGHYVKVPMGQMRSLGVHQKPRRVRFAAAAACPKPVSRKYEQWKKREEELVKLLREHRANKPSR